MSIQFNSSEYVTIAGQESHIDFEHNAKNIVAYNDSKVGCDVIIAQRKDDD